MRRALLDPLPRCSDTVPGAVLAELGAIVNISELSPMNDAVSWTDKPVSYYLHTVDRTMVSRGFSLPVPCPSLIPASALLQTSPSFLSSLSQLLGQASGLLSAYCRQDHG